MEVGAGSIGGAHRQLIYWLGVPVSWVSLEVAESRG
jgi:hypothetical protein